MCRIFELVLIIAAFGIFSLEAKAQVGNSPSTQHPQSAEQGLQEPGKQQITASELPVGVKQALKSDVLKEWQISEVYIVASNVEDAGVDTTYEVYFTNAEQKRAIARFNEEGEPIAEQ